MPTNQKSVVVYGPQGIGKGLHAEHLNAFFGCAEVIDDYIDPYGDLLTKPSALILADEEPPPALRDHPRVISFHYAMLLAGPGAAHA